MTTTAKQDEQIAGMVFSKIYPLYVAKEPANKSLQLLQAPEECKF